MKQLFVALYVCLACCGASAQSLRFENDFHGKSYTLKPGEIFFIQTLDDPAGFSTKAQYLSFARDTMVVCKPHRPEQTVKIPVTHISSVYLRNRGAGFMKFVLIGGGVIFEIAALVLIFEEDFVAFIEVMVGIPLIKAGFDIRTRTRLYLPNYNIKRLSVK